MQYSKKNLTKLNINITIELIILRTNNNERF